MCRNEGAVYAQSCRLKTARQKRRAQKADREKQLIRLEKLRTKLWLDKQQLPWIPLEEPYQKGWKRFFVLREDVKRSHMADFYQTLLNKINTAQYSRDKTFSSRKRRLRRYEYTVRTQALREISVSEWNSPKLELTEKENLLFYRYERWCYQSGFWKVGYVFAEPWRFVLRVRPHIITEQRMIDADLEAEFQRLENYIERNNLHGKIYKLTRSNRGPRNWYKKKDIPSHPFKNKPLHVVLAECKETTIT